MGWITRLETTEGWGKKAVSGDLSLMHMWGIGTKLFSAATTRPINDPSKLCKCLGYKQMSEPRQKVAFWISVTDIGNT